MLARERQKLIYQRLETVGRVVASDLASEFAVSEDSIRRDLREMATAQLCERVYGGALKLDRVTPMRAREHVDVAAKRKLAGAVVAHLSEGCSVFVDASSTNLEIVRAIPVGLRLTVFTNAPHIAAELADNIDINVILIGGHVTPGIGACVDTRSVQDALLINPDLYLMGVCGLSDIQEVTAEHHGDAVFKRVIAERASRIIVPVTGSKMGRDHRYTIMPLNDKVRIVATGVPENELEACLKRGCDVEIVSPS